MGNRCGGLASALPLILHQSVSEISAHDGFAVGGKSRRGSAGLRSYGSREACAAPGAALGSGAR